MTKRFSADQMYQLARIGAQARLAELHEEIAAIRAAFHDLAGAPARRGRSTDGETPKPRRKRRKLSVKARAAISAAQKKRWAKVRAGKKQ